MNEGLLASSRFNCRNEKHDSSETSFNLSLRVACPSGSHRRHTWTGMTEKWQGLYALINRSRPSVCGARNGFIGKVPPSKQIPLSKFRGLLRSCLQRLQHGKTDNGFLGRLRDAENDRAGLPFFVIRQDAMAAWYSYHRRIAWTGVEHRSKALAVIQINPPPLTVGTVKRQKTGMKRDYKP